MPPRLIVHLLDCFSFAASSYKKYYSKHYLEYYQVSSVVVLAGLSSDVLKLRQYARASNVD